jgi:hypothetical protein
VWNLTLQHVQRWEFLRRLGANRINKDCSMSFPISEIRTRTLEEGIRNRMSTQEVDYLDYQPGNGTRYPMVITAINDLMAEKLDMGSPGHMVTLVNSLKSVFLAEGVFLHWSYLADKLDLHTPDAVAVAEILGHLLGRPYVSAEDFVRQRMEFEDDDQQEEPQEDQA